MWHVGMLPVCVCARAEATLNNHWLVILFIEPRRLVDIYTTVLPSSRLLLASFFVVRILRRISSRLEADEVFFFWSILFIFVACASHLRTCT